MSNNYPTEKEWIDDLKIPYETTVGGTNQPPTSLAELINLPMEDPIELYRALDEAESAFAVPPEWVNQGIASDHFDDFSNISQIDEGKLGKNDWQVQRAKWYTYPKLRILAALKKNDGEIPSAEVIVTDWHGGPPENILELIIELDEYTWVDTESANSIAEDIRRGGAEQLEDFLYDQYKNNRDLKTEIKHVEITGVKYALYEAYDERIEKLNEVVHEYGDGIWAGVGDELKQAEHEARQSRKDIEREVADAFNTQIVPHLESLEEQFEELASEHGTEQEDEGAVEEMLEERLWELRQDIQQWSITEASDLEAEVARLASVRRKIERAFEDERFESSEALTEIVKLLEAMDDDLTELSAQVDNRAEELHEEFVQGAVTGDSYDEEQPVLEELARVLLLASHLQPERAENDKKGDGETNMQGE